MVTTLLVGNHYVLSTITTCDILRDTMLGLIPTYPYALFVYGIMVFVVFLCLLEMIIQNVYFLNLLVNYSFVKIS